MDFELHSWTHFRVSDDRRLSDLFTQIKGFDFDANVKKWTFPIQEYPTLISLMKTKMPAIQLNPIPNSILKLAKKSTDNPEKSLDAGKGHVNLEGIEKKIRLKLLPFQVEGVQRAIQWQGRILIADEMGVGKSIQALAVASYYRQEWPLLIICPSSLSASWTETVKDWMPSLSPDRICTIFNGKNIKDMMQSKDHLVYIMSYDMAVKAVDSLNRFKISVAIIDECHFLKSRTSKRTMTLFPVIKAINRRILLSGTPALSRPVELYTQMQLIEDIFPNFYQYATRYCDARKGLFGLDCRGASHKAELQLILERFIMIRRLKGEVLTQLPPKIREQIFLHLSDKDLKIFGKKMKNVKPSVLDSLDNDITNDPQVMQLWAMSATAKLPSMKQYILDLLEVESKILLFGHHREVLDSFSEFFGEKEIGFIRIDGLTPSSSRFELCEKFRTDPIIKVALLSITAAGTGLTLTAASTVVFSELYWNPGILFQAEDRAHRIGQRDCVNVKYLLGKGTFDDTFWPKIVKKLDVLEAVGLTKNEFKDLNAVHLDHIDKSQQKLTAHFEVCNKQSNPNTSNHNSNSNNRGLPFSKKQKSIHGFLSGSSNNANKAITVSDEILIIDDDNDDDDFVHSSVAVRPAVTMKPTQKIPEVVVLDENNAAIIDEDYGDDDLWIQLDENQ